MILVAGGTGRLGRALVPMLVGAGYQVRVMARGVSQSFLGRATASNSFEGTSPPKRTAGRRWRAVRRPCSRPQDLASRTQTHAQLTAMAPSGWVARQPQPEWSMWS
jgi:nucleoside-diphosphate-sugar epimerase